MTPPLLLGKFEINHTFSLGKFQINCRFSVGKFEILCYNMFGNSKKS